MTADAGNDNPLDCPKDKLVPVTFVVWEMLPVEPSEVVLKVKRPAVVFWVICAVVCVRFEEVPEIGLEASLDDATEGWKPNDGWVVVFALLEVLLSNSGAADNDTAGTFEVPLNNPVILGDFEELFGVSNVKPTVPVDPLRIPLCGLGSAWANSVFDPVVAFVRLVWSLTIPMKLVNRPVRIVLDWLVVVGTLVHGALETASDVMVVDGKDDVTVIVELVFTTDNGVDPKI